MTTQRNTDALIEDLRAYGVETHGAQAQASLPWIAADALAASEAARVAAEAKAARLERDWLIRLDQDREFLQQVADSHGIKTDEVTVAFLERKALSSAPVAPAPTDERVREAIIEILNRGNVVPEWPDDEAAAYRDNGRWQEGNAAVDALRADKIIALVRAVVPSEATTDESADYEAALAEWRTMVNRWPGGIFEWRDEQSFKRAWKAARGELMEHLPVAVQGITDEAGVER